MSITISKDGFVGSISSSNGDIYIQTADNKKTIHLGLIKEFTGSLERTKDPSTGNVTFTKERKADGTFEEIKYDPTISGRKIESKIKDPVKGREFIRSGSATANQIEFHQSTNAAFVIVSGSDPGFNVFSTTTKAKGTMRSLGMYTLSQSTAQSTNWSWGMSRTDRNFYIAPTITIMNNQAHQPFHEQNQYFKIEHDTGDVHIKGGNLIIESGDITAQNYIVSSSVTHLTSSAMSGSTTFGNSADDTHTFTGAITASSHISASGNIIGKQYHITHHNMGSVGASQYYIPFPTSTTESTGTSYLREWIAPFDGTLEKIRMYAETAGGNTICRLYVNRVQAAGASSTSDTVSVSATTTANFTFSSGNTFSAGDLIRVTIDGTNNLGDINMVCIWAYDTNTL